MKTFDEIKGEVHDTSGVGNPNNYYWGMRENIYYPIGKIPKNMFYQLNNEYVCDDNFIHIDAYKTDDGNEEGKTIAMVCLDTFKVIYMDNDLRMNEQVKEFIQETIEEYKRDERSPTDVLEHCTDALGLSLDYDAEYKAVAWIAYNMGKGLSGDRLNELENETLNNMYRDYRSSGLV